METYLWYNYNTRVDTEEDEAEIRTSARRKSGWLREKRARVESPVLPQWSPNEATAAAAEQVRIKTVQILNLLPKKLTKDVVVSFSIFQVFILVRIELVQRVRSKKMITFWKKRCHADDITEFLILFR